MQYEITCLAANVPRYGQGSVEVCTSRCNMARTEAEGTVR